MPRGRCTPQQAQDVARVRGRPTWDLSCKDGAVLGVARRQAHEQMQPDRSCVEPPGTASLAARRKLLAGDLMHASLLLRAGLRLCRRQWRHQLEHEFACAR